MSFTVSSGPLTIPKVSLLAFLQSPADMITINPLVVSYFSRPDPNNPNLNGYEIKDTFALPFGIRGCTFTYSATFNNTSDGMKTVTVAPGGVETRSTWRVEELTDNGDEARFKVVEDFEVDAPWYVKWFVIRTAQNAHVELLKTLERAVKERYSDGN